MLIMALSGTWDRNRTDTPVKEPDFESGASTNFATQAQETRNCKAIQGVFATLG